MKEEKKYSQPGERIVSETNGSGMIDDYDEKVVVPKNDKEETGKYVDTDITHIVVPGDFSTTYIPLNKVDTELTTKSEKTK